MNKKVRFDETQNKTLNMIVWSYAYKEARRGMWRQEVADRMRFKRRIESVGLVLKDVLNMEHRNRVYSERFALK